jgi:multidrug resistance protein, MATE family
MHEAPTYDDSPVARTGREELRSTLRLAGPIVVVQLGMMLMGVVDTIFVGHLSAAALGAVALGNLYFFNVAHFSVGTLLALDPLVAQAVGARDEAAVARAMQRGLLLAVALSAFTALLMLPAAEFLRAFRQQPEILPAAAGYIRISIWGVLPFLGFVVLRQSLQALHRLRPIVVTIVVANAANVFLNWVLVYGNLGVSALGSDGSAWATAASRWLMALLLLWLARDELIRRLVPMRREALALVPLARMMRIGVPIGLQHLLEVGAFGVIGLLMGTLGTAEIAAHQVAITLAATTFMVPLGVGAAAAVRVGHAVGAGDPHGARLAARVALQLGVGFMVFSGVVFLAFPAALGRIYTSEPGVLALAVLLIPVAGVFQVFDGLQAVSVGILRGVGDVDAPFIIALVGFWLIGFPVSWYLGFHTPAGAIGLWWGFVAGLAAVGVILVVRVRVRLQRTIERIER